MLALLIVVWQVYVAVANVPHYILPSPLRIAQAFLEDYGRCSSRRCGVTLQTTFLALAIALVSGVALAILMAQSRWIELALFPYAVILQVTPIVAIAPLILIYTQHHAAGAADLRLAGRVLPGPFQHGAGPAARPTTTSSTCSSFTAPAAGRR